MKQVTARSMRAGFSYEGRKRFLLPAGANL